MKFSSLCYHDVVEPGALDSSGFPGEVMATYKLDRDRFRDHLVAIHRIGRARPGSVMDSLRTDGGVGGMLPCLFTFDDGGVSAHDIIAPLLEGFGWPGHFFVITGRIGAPGFMTAAQIRSMRRRGHLIGSHSCSHEGRMSSWSYDRLEADWSASAGALARVLDEPVAIASVPSGFSSRRVAAAASRAGIRALFTLEPVLRAGMVERCLVLGRCTIRRNTPAATAARLAAGDLAPRLEQWLLWQAKQTAKSSLGGCYSKAREAYFLWQARIRGSARTTF